MPRLHEYRVGVASNLRTIEAPSPVAAAVFYGLQTAGRGETLAAVLEEDGRPWKGAAVWMAWAMGQEPEQRDLELLQVQLPHCRFASSQTHLARRPS
jgi:hypothetical protein